MLYLINIHVSCISIWETLNLLSCANSNTNMKMNQKGRFKKINHKSCIWFNMAGGTYVRTCHVSCVMCYVSHVACHLSPVTCQYR